MLHANGVSQVHVEAFDIRTGIGPDLSIDIELLVKQVRQWVSVRRAHIQQMFDFQGRFP
jgi:hypothetical protein